MRIGVTGLARAGKTAFLTALAANLLAMGAGVPTLPALATRLGGRRLGVALAPSAAAAVPRFDYAAHLDALAADPATWPARTNAVSLLALDLTVPRGGLASVLPAREVRLEFLDYPGEWLLDLPLLRQDFAAWSESALRRLEGLALARDFLSFIAVIPAGAAADETLAATGQRLYQRLLHALRDEVNLAFLQPGRFLMPAPGPQPPWMQFFPLRGRGGLTNLLGQRYAAYTDAVRADLLSPLFGKLDRMVVLADLLSALAAGRDSFADTQSALAAASAALRWQFSWTEAFASLLSLRRPPPVIRRVAYAATKADHVAARQRGNLRGLMRALTPGAEGLTAAHFALASIRCTEDAPWQLGGRSVSAVRGRVAGQGMALSYPGEVPDQPPDAAFWTHEFFALPEFEPHALAECSPGGGAADRVGLAARVSFGRLAMSRPPRLLIEDPHAPRLDPALLIVEPLIDPVPRTSGAMLALAGVAVLVVGLAALETANFVAAQFDRAPWLGWLTLAVAVLGFGLLFAAVGRELRGLYVLGRVDSLRAALASGDAHRIHKAARRWATSLPEAPALVVAIDAANDPDAILALLRAGPVAGLRARSDALGRTAAFQMAAGIAATPAPALAVLLIAWRGVRLIRQVAALYGMRPGLLGTLGLLRRSMLAAGLVAGSEAAVNAAAHAVLSNPLLAHVFGDMAGAGVAARRMILLARATAAACSPLPPPDEGTS